MPSYQHRKSRWWDKTILCASYLHNGISYTVKTTSLNWIGAPGVETTTAHDTTTSCTYFMGCIVVLIRMMTSSNGNIFRVTGPLCGEFTGPRWIPRTKASDAERWCFLWSAAEWTVERLNKWLSKQSWGWWFETLPGPLWPPIMTSK